MSQQELLARLLQILPAAGIEYMVTGSIASSVHGEPRLTHDIDVVVVLNPQAIRSLAQAFPPPEFYLSEEAALQAARQHSMFNLLSLTGGEKVDFWVLTDEPFDRSRFARKRLEELQGLRFFVSTPEDLILAKLRWAKLAGGSEKQFTDALRVYEIQRPTLDQGYVDQWAGQLGVSELWQDLRAKAEPI